MNTWPTKFPDPLLSTMALDPGAPVIRTQMAGGITRQRRRFVNEWRVQNFTMQFTEESYDFFQKWVEVKISGGADFFNMQLRMGGGIKTYQVRFIVSESGAPYKSSFRDPYWIVSGSFEIFVLSLPTASSLSTYINS